MGTLAPTSVYNHPAAWAHPWRWAAVHALFILAACVASVVNWWLIETAHARAEDQQARARRLHTLTRGNQLISASLDMDHLLQEIAQATAERAWPIIFITGHGDIPMTVKAMKAGAVACLAKPFSEEVLLQALQAALPAW
jgi:response regulator receiver domain-containing protein